MFMFYASLLKNKLLEGGEDGYETTLNLSSILVCICLCKFCFVTCFLHGILIGSQLGI